MCDFFSFITYKDKTYYFSADERLSVDDNHDSHSAIAERFVGKNACDKCNKYEFIPSAGTWSFRVDQRNDQDHHPEDAQAWLDHFVTTKKWRDILLVAVATFKRDPEEILPVEMRAKVNRVLHEHAIRCAESCVANYEKEYPGDTRVRDAIEAKRKWLDGKITNAGLDAARSAARLAAWSAARSAAESAAESAARSVAELAAWLAARSAAESAAESAARSAARSVAGSAAWSAAESAAGSAAESAAWSVAWSAARIRQRDELIAALRPIFDDGPTEES